MHRLPKEGPSEMRYVQYGALLEYVQGVREVLLPGHAEKPLCMQLMPEKYGLLVP